MSSASDITSRMFATAREQHRAWLRNQRREADLHEAAADDDVLLLELPKERP